MATHDVDEAILTLIGSGQADTRPAIVKQTGLAASTVSAAVSRLVEAGVIAEADESVSTGGRRARRLVTSEAHPHGDSAIYDTLVRMAQSWSMRYTVRPISAIVIPIRPKTPIGENFITQPVGIRISGNQNVGIDLLAQFF